MSADTRVGRFPQQRPPAAGTVPVIGAAPPHSLEAEQAVLGVILLTPKVLGVLFADEQLRPEHFYRERHGLIYQAMLAVYDRGASPDTITVCDQLRSAGDLDTVGGPTAVDELAVAVPAAGNVRRYAQIVVEHAAWRDRLRATFQMQLAIHDADEQAFAAAEAMLANKPQGAQRAYDQTELGLAVSKLLDGGTVDAFPWPLEKFNRLTRGGMRRGQVTLVTGPTRHGKSPFLDQCLESAADCEKRPKVGLFINEMSADARGLRIVARRANLSYTKLELASAGEARLSDNEMRIAYEVLEAMPFQIIECAGWTAAEICREARRRRLDVVGIDIIQRLPHRQESRVRELEDASNEFDRLAKETGAHVLVAAHINRARSGLSPVVPFPSMNDIRDCAQLANDADNVLIVWREQDSDTGDPEPEGIIRFAKIRNGEPGGLAVDFFGDRQRFLASDRVDL